MNYTLPQLSYLRFRFKLIAQERCTLPGWKGSLLRGAFGHALRRTACTMSRGQQCIDCMLRAQCAYTKIFETFINGDPPPFLKGLDTPPRPIIFEPNDMSRSYESGDALWFDTILLGDSIQYFPYLIYSIYQMGETGLGRDRHPFTLVAGHCYQSHDEGENDYNLKKEENWRIIYDGDSQKILYKPRESIMSHNGSAIPEKIKIDFLTQTRLKFRSNLTMDFTFRMLVFKMLRRILELAHFYSDPAAVNWEFHDLLEAADEVKIEDRELVWNDVNRYSNRQHANMKLGGFTGSITLTGNLAPFINLLHYSEILHVGKGAMFGLGKIRIDCSNRPNQSTVKKSGLVEIGTKHAKD